MKTTDINKVMALFGLKFRKDCVDYVAAMSPYNFDPEADALSAELRRAEKAKDVAAFRAVSAQIREFVKRKTAAREATK